MGSVPGVGVRANCVCGCVCGCACTRLGVSWDSGGILWRSVPGVGCRANCVCGCACTRVGIAVTGLDVGPTASAGRKSLRPAQLPSAMPRVALLRVNRACAHGQRSAAVGVCWSDAHWISCSLKRERLQQTCLLLLLSTRRNAISLIYRLSAALGMRHTRSPGAALAQPWRSPGAALAHTGTLPAHWHTPARSRHAPRHTGTHRHTPARSPAHKYAGCCRVIPSFLHLPPPHASRPAA